MAYDLKEVEFLAMIAIVNLRKRYGYCVKKIADHGSVYLLESKASLCVIGPDEREMTMVPVWPHPRFAEDYLARSPIAMPSWGGATTIEIEVRKFLEERIPQFRANGYAIAAFPVAPGRAGVVTVSEFEANLRYELSRIE